MREVALNADGHDELLTPKEAARLMGVAVSTLRDWRWRGTGPSYLKLSPGRGGRVRYRRADVLAHQATLAVEAA